MSAETPEAAETAVTLYNPESGELLRIVAERSGDDELAHVKRELIPSLKDQLRAAEDVVDRVLVDRSDRLLEGTRRVFGPDEQYQWEIVVPSAQAGTERWDAHALDGIVSELVAEGVLVQAGAANVIRRTVTVVFAADTAEDLAAIIDRARADDRICTVGDPEVSVKQAGVNALLKLPGMRERLEPARLDVDPPKRRPKIRRIERREVRR